MTQPLTYQTTVDSARWATDLAYLKTLSICHYVFGGLSLAFSCIFIIYIVVGVLMLSGTIPVNTGPRPVATPGAATATPTTTPAAVQVTSEETFAGWLMVGIGSGGLLIGWTLGILTILSGRCIARQRSRIFSLVMAGFCCLSVPLGTLLGVFTFVVLLRQSVQALYDHNKPTAGASIAG